MLVHQEFLVVTLNLYAPHDLVVLHVHTHLFIVFRVHDLTTVLIHLLNCVGGVRIIRELLHILLLTAPILLLRVIFNVHYV